MKGVAFLHTVVGLSLLICSSLFVYAPSLLAQSGGSNGQGTEQGSNGQGGENSITNPLKVESITEFLLAIIEILLIFATPFVVIYIMYAGFLFVTSRGSASELEHAKSALLFALIGGVIIVGAQVIINIIQNTVNSIR